MERAELTSELRDTLVQVLSQQGLVLNHYVVTKGCRPGDNYLGEVLRVTATATSQHSSEQDQQYRFIFKCPPASKKWREGLKINKYFRNETAFYTKVLPQLENFRMKHCGNELQTFSVPKCYFSMCDSENDVVVLEDLAKYDYVLADRMKCLDFDHCNLVLQELGRLHAASIAMKSLEPSQFEKIKIIPREVYFFEEGRPEFATVHMPCNAALRMVRKRYPETDYAEKLEKIATNIFDKMMAIVESETPLSVISHGDCWTNNIMFKYHENGKPEKVKFLDFQNHRYSSVALDLSFFIYVCTTQQTRCMYWEELITVYLAELNDALAKYGTPTAQVSRAQLDAELGKFARFGIGMALFTIPLFTTPIDQQPSLDGGLEVFDIFHQNSHKNPLCFERLTDAVDDAMKRGYFDN